MVTPEAPRASTHAPFYTIRGNLHPDAPSYVERQADRDLYDALTRGAMSAFLYRVSGSPVYTPPTTPTFSDVPKSNPFYKEIEWMNAEGITTGYPNGTYKPNLTLNRGEMSAFLHRLVDLGFAPG